MSVIKYNSNYCNTCSSFTHVPCSLYSLCSICSLCSLFSLSVHEVSEIGKLAAAGKSPFSNYKINSRRTRKCTNNLLIAFHNSIIPEIDRIENLIHDKGFAVARSNFNDDNNAR